MGLNWVLSVMASLADGWTYLLTSVDGAVFWGRMKELAKGKCRFSPGKLWSLLGARKKPILEIEG